eukprot:TRINITY_DN4484_c0_g1_i7.p1 TRINITY_DN4484_c0_g1~~TRINITY_DN4484_c0_g1_i7.p1  ORF type:complete len:168 (-),score=45.70 TRINITY_DN4484_c0_g1_i7:153-656(-)
MFIFLTILASMALSTTYSKTVNKASSPYTNCGCQCSSLTFRDTSGTVQGNCKTVDGTGAQWCYVDSSSSSCQDLVPSERFPHNPWSYEACATPDLGSHLCPVYPPVVTVADHVHVPVVVPAADHVHAPLIISAPSHIHEYVGHHNTDIPQGLNAPIPKAAGLKAPEK